MFPLSLVREQARYVAVLKPYHASTDLQPNDAVLLRAVLHDWNDADATAILKNIRGRMPRGATLLLVELAPDELESHQALGPGRLGIDLHMMVSSQPGDCTQHLKIFGPK